LLNVDDERIFITAVVQRRADVNVIFCDFHFPSPSISITGIPRRQRDPLLFLVPRRNPDLVAPTRGWISLKL
jgi:hypothetical protein